MFNNKCEWTKQSNQKARLSDQFKKKKQDPNGAVTWVVFGGCYHGVVQQGSKGAHQGDLADLDPCLVPAGSHRV